MVNLGGFAGGAASGAVVSIIINAVDNFSEPLKKAQSAITGMNKSFVAAGAAITTAGVAAAAGIIKLATSASEYNTIQQAFNKLVGTEAPALLKKMQEGLAGTVSEMELMKGSNLVFQNLGKDSVKVMETITATAGTLGDAVGKSNTEAFQIATEAIAKQKFGMLENIGVTIDQQKALEEYAKKSGKLEGVLKSLATEGLGKNSEEIEKLKEKLSSLSQKEGSTGREIATLQKQIRSEGDEYGKLGNKLEDATLQRQAYLDEITKIKTELSSLQGLKESDILNSEMESEAIKKVVEGLTEEEKRIALTNAALEGMTAAAEKVGPTTEGLDDQFERISATFDNISRKIGQLMEPFVKFFADVLEKVTKFMSELDPKWLKLIANITMIGTAVALILGPLIMFIGLLPILATAVGALTMAALPWLLIILAIIAAITAIILLFVYWDKIMNFFVKTIEKVGIGLSGFAEFLSGIFKAVKETVIGTLEYIRDKALSIIQSILDKINAVLAAAGKILGAIADVGRNIISGIQAKISPKMNDFISRPGQAPVPFSPDDTIIGVKNPGKLSGGSVIINIDTIQGMDPDEVARALKTRLSDLIST